MILVLFCLITIIISFLLIILLSNIRVKIDNLQVDNFKLNEEYQVFYQVYFLNKIKIFSKKIDYKKIKNISSKDRLRKIKSKNIKMDKELRKIILKSIPKIESMNLNINIGFDDAKNTAYLVGILNAIIGVILPHIANDMKKINYSIKPRYNKNIVYIHLDSIISIKTVHIIYVIFKLIMKGSAENERTSNRRIDAYCNE